MPQGVAQHAPRARRAGVRPAPGRPSPTMRSRGRGSSGRVAIVDADRIPLADAHGTLTAPVRDRQRDQPQLLLGLLGDPRLGVGESASAPAPELERIEDRVDRGDHRVDEQAGEHLQVGGGPVAQDGEAGEVGRQLGGEQPGLRADGVAQDGVARRPGVRHEGEVAPVLAHMGDEDLDRPRDEAGPSLRGAALACLAQHRAQRRHRLLHQRQPELVHAVEVAVERGWHDAGRAGDPAQAQRVKAVASVHLLQRGVEQRAPRLPAAFGLGAPLGRTVRRMLRGRCGRRRWLAASTPVHATHVGVITDAVFALALHRAYPLYRL